MTVGLIWAQSADGVIGCEGRLPWHLPEDLARFRSVTLGSTVVMGRRTWESLPEAFRPLPGRTNVVLTRRPEWGARGALVARSLVEALDLAREKAGEDVWVIGGASVLQEALGHADRLEVTELADSFEGDVLAPVLGPGWRPAQHHPEGYWLVSRTGLRYRNVTYLPVDLDG